MKRYFELQNIIKKAIYQFDQNTRFFYSFVVIENKFKAMYDKNHVSISKDRNVRSKSD